MKPMHSRVGSTKTLTYEGFIFEPKFDGTRVLIYKKGNSIKLINRNGRDITHKYPELSEIGKNIKDNSITDGELVIIGKKHIPDFNLWQQRDKASSPEDIVEKSRIYPATIFVFDILELKGKNLTEKPLLERKQLLSSQIKNSKNLVLTPFSTKGEALWKKITRIGMEGVMAKRADGGYYPGKRTDEWIKIKQTNTIDAIIIGYTVEKRALSSLMLAAYHKGKPKYIGRVGTGFNDRLISELLSKFKPTKEPLVRAEKTYKKLHYVKPNLVAEIKYFEITNDHKLRGPVFLNLRTDKKPRDCVI